jgi:hypothetical protein
LSATVGVDDVIVVRVREGRREATNCRDIGDVRTQGFTGVVGRSATAADGVLDQHGLLEVRFSQASELGKGERVAGGAGMEGDHLRAVLAARGEDEVSLGDERLGELLGGMHLFGCSISQGKGCGLRCHGLCGERTRPGAADGRGNGELGETRTEELFG